MVQTLLYPLAVVLYRTQTVSGCAVVKKIESWPGEPARLALPTTDRGRSRREGEERAGMTTEHGSLPHEARQEARREGEELAITSVHKLCNTCKYRLGLLSSRNGDAVRQRARPARDPAWLSCSRGP